MLTKVMPVDMLDDNHLKFKNTIAIKMFWFWICLKTKIVILTQDLQNPIIDSRVLC